MKHPLLDPPVKREKLDRPTDVEDMIHLCEVVEGEIVFPALCGAYLRQAYMPEDFAADEADCVVCVAIARERGLL